MVSLIETADSVSMQSGGAFDITVFPLIKLWGFYEDTQHVPGEEELKRVLEQVDYHNLSVKNGTLYKQHAPVMIDLGGIAKGYAVKEAVRVLKADGISSALIDAGGDIYALGMINGKPWKVGIRNPRGEGVIGVLEISDLSVVTSGDYERFFEQDGVRYHHLLDPKTGYPARGLTSVTVVSADPALADAWSTALFVSGKEKGIELAERIPQIEALFVTSEGDILKTSGMK